MKALFAIRNKETSKLVAGVVFENKLEAKKYRNKLHGDAGSPMNEDGTPNYRYAVTYGPEHWKFQTAQN